MNRPPLPLPRLRLPAGLEMPVLAPPPLLHLAVLGDLVVRAVVAVAELLVVPAHVLGHVRVGLQVAALVDERRLPAVAERRVGLIGGDRGGGLWPGGGGGGSSGGFGSGCRGCGGRRLGGGCGAGLGSGLGMRSGSG